MRTEIYKKDDGSFEAHLIEDYPAQASVLDKDGKKIITDKANESTTEIRAEAEYVLMIRREFLLNWEPASAPVVAPTLQRVG